ncbi:hypothetical protein CVT26_000343 [Gymnopilus dilepis]|uniref:Uncharacterized protein n=1 Tax=Gymnopilus dilepis TaxID=231916 RepID=A0A409VHP1_9AGAR|nr:hypothetical protein CVT26_000343 [Gymnopilus dilepis]
MASCPQCLPHSCTLAVSLEMGTILTGSDWILAPTNVMTLIMVGMGDVVLVSLEQLLYLLFLRKLMLLDLAMLSCRSLLVILLSSIMLFCEIGTTLFVAR